MSGVEIGSLRLHMFSCHIERFRSEDTHVRFERWDNVFIVDSLPVNALEPRMRFDILKSAPSLAIT